MPIDSPLKAPQQISPSLVVKAALLVLALVALAMCTVFYAPAITRLVSNSGKLREYLLSYGPWSVAVFMALQVLQVVVAAIPGEVTQLAGGYLYGTAAGAAYSLIGIMLGSVIVFFTIRFLGYPVLQAFMPKKSLEKFDFLVNNPKAELAMFVLFAIPGIPKDVLTYIAGLTPIRKTRFLIIATVGRLPGILFSSYIGAHMEQRHYTQVIVASGLVAALFVAGILLRGRIIGMLKKHHDAGAPPA
ncbi:MAG TPA: TVP38/TMEM64 family protein [Candidatus Edwardsbacteria bacterium]|nr:TVP38/TMEM64 family protein [Candidatus Edwardsbacteria bacterium]